MKRKSAQADWYRYAHYLARRGVFLYYPGHLTIEQLIAQYNARNSGGNWRRIP